jgi:hypothetical protein
MLQELPIRVKLAMLSWSPSLAVLLILQELAR